MVQHLDGHALVQEVLSTMLSAHPTDVVCVWENGSVSVERFAFCGRKLPKGGYDVPVAYFVVGGRPPTEDEVGQEILRGLTRRGWSAAS